MKKSAKQATNMEKPFVLDPVGIGISKIRNETPIEIIKESKPAIIRGNLSEIKAIAMFYGILDECTTATLKSLRLASIKTSINKPTRKEIIGHAMPA